MSSFSIDEVRVSFTADMTSFLERIERTAQGALSQPILRPETLEGEGRAVFTTLGELGHAVFGTTSLVGAESLRESARALEELALAGDEALERVERAAAMAREIAQACAEGATRMQQMLAIELDNRGPEARGLANEWVAWARWLKLHVASEGAPADANAPLLTGAPAFAAGEDTFAFESEPVPVEPVDAEPVATFAPPAEAPPAEPEAAPSSSEGGFDFDERAERDPAFGGELLEIFRREGCETLRPLGEQIAALRAQPEDLAAVGNIERLFHTLKGASATVGLEEVSHAAARLQERMDDVLEQGIKVSPAFVDALVAETNEMLGRAQLPLLTLPEVGPASAGGTARAFFLEEVQEIQEEAQYLVDELGAASAETVLRARAELGKLFHRLKGSALIVGEERVGVEAEKLQVLFERDETASTAHGSIARSALARIAKLLGQEALAGAALSAAVPAPVSLKLQREPVTLTAEAELWDAFKQESGELIEALERETLALEESQQPQQVLEKLMNLLHTLKGVLNTIGLAPTARELHRVEDFIETLLKAPILPPMRAVATLLLKVQGDVRRNLGEAKQGFVETSMARLEARISKALLGANGRAVRAQGRPTDDVDGGSVRARERGASVHSIADARSVRVGMVSAHVPAASSAREPAEDLVDRRFIRVGAERLDSLMNLAGELVVSRSRMLNRVSTLRQLQQELGRGSKRLVETVDEFREGYEYASLDGRGKRGLHERKIVALSATPVVTPGWEGFGELELDRYEDIHILSRRLAEIVGDVSELSVQLAHGLTSFADDSQSFDAIVSGIKNEVTRARMVPLDLLFTRLRLPVRDAASRETKDVRVTTEGAELNLDKTIADALFAPMLHLVRNAVVHGIEGTNVRQAAGKPTMGVITLRARQDSGQIVVEVKDDGAGLDLEALRTRGARMGLVSADTPLSDPAIKDLVFAAGLSTRQQAGAVSGRGVGCDVVRRAVERMNGTISVESEPGRGTTFVITLPVTLAITKALLVRQGKRTYAIPLYFAERLVDAEDGTVVESAGQRRIKVDDVYMTVNRFDQHLGGGAAEPGKRGPILLLRVGDQRAALQVDAVLGQEEVVVKSLGDVLVGHPLFAGVTIRGTGELVLIVDVPGLMETKARRAEQGAARPRERRARENVAAAPAALAARPARLKVLFVDDSLSVRKYAELTFKALGVDVTLANDGIDALARLRHESFDLVFTDLEMPRMHGFELIRELRFVPAYRDLPIVVVTSRSGQKHQQQARALGATEYLTKPFSAEVLAAVLARWGGRDKGKGGGKAKPDPRERLS